MYYEIYIDQFFAEQLFCGYLLLSLALYAAREKCGAGQLFAADILYAAMQCVYVLTGQIPAAALGAVLAVPVVFGTGKRLKGLFFLALVSVCLGGTVQALVSLLPAGAGMCAFAAFFLIRAARQRIEKYRLELGRRADVTLFWKETRMSFRALVDTGNHLREPLTGRPVSILDGACADVLLGEGWEEKKGFFLIPYHSIGKPHGWMRGVAVDRMYIDTASGQTEVRKPLFAISNGKVSAKDRYQVILNPEQIKI